MLHSDVNHATFFLNFIGQMSFRFLCFIVILMYIVLHFVFVTVVNWSAAAVCLPVCLL